jgi:hypothetical protein
MELQTLLHEDQVSINHCKNWNVGAGFFYCDVFSMISTTNEIRSNLDISMEPKFSLI